MIYDSFYLDSILRKYLNGEPFDLEIPFLEILGIIPREYWTVLYEKVHENNVLHLEDKRTKKIIFKMTLDETYRHEIEYGTLCIYRKISESEWKKILIFELGFKFTDYQFEICNGSCKILTHESGIQTYDYGMNDQLSIQPNGVFMNYRHIKSYPNPYWIQCDETSVKIMHETEGVIREYNITMLFNSSDPDPLLKLCKDVFLYSSRF